MNTFALAEDKEWGTPSGAATRCIIFVEVGLRSFFTAAEVELLVVGLRYTLLQATLFCLRAYFQLRNTLRQVPGKSANTSRFQAWSRVPVIIVILGLIAALGGCEPVQSLYPFFDPKNLVYDSYLNGTWITEKDDGFYMKMVFQGQDKTQDYQVDLSFYNDKAEQDKPTEGTIRFSVHLFQAGSCRFADFFPLTYSAKSGSRAFEFEASDNLFGIPTHTVYRITKEKGRLQLSWLDDGRIKRFIEKNNLPLAVEGKNDFVLIGKTEELRTNLLLNAEKEELLDGDGVEFARQP